MFASQILFRSSFSPIYNTTSSTTSQILNIGYDGTSCMPGSDRILITMGSENLRSLTQCAFLSVGDT
jgi:hypothetical protein